MLNCSDLECVLHHHHYYQHLHQLQQPHLARLSLQHSGKDALSTAAEDVGDGDLQLPDNETNAFQSSYLDSPSENIYMIFGLLMSMVLVGVVIILLAVTISKLRKRDDQQHQVNQQQQHQQCCGPQVQVHPAGSTRCNLRGVDNPAMAADGDCSDELEICWANNNQQQPMATTTVNGNDEPFQHIWQFPPPPYPDKVAQRFALYNDQDSLVHGQGVVAGPVESQLQGQHQKSFRKNLGGRWRRLVRKKPPESTVCGAIPPELKDQLKTIYVY